MEYLVLQNWLGRLGSSFQNFTHYQVQNIIISNKNLKLKFSTDFHEGRIAGSHLHKDYDNVFTGSQTGTDDNYDWAPWEGVILLMLRN